MGIAILEGSLAVAAEMSNAHTSYDLEITTLQGHSRKTHHLV